MTFRFVFEARVKPGCTEEQYIDAWRSGSAIIQREPGALGTRLHRDAPGVLVAIATWESKAARDAAAKELGLTDDIVDNTDSVLRSHLQFADIAPLFGLDEIGAVDPPRPKSSWRPTIAGPFGIPKVRWRTSVAGAGPHPRRRRTSVPSSLRAPSG